MKNRLRRIRIFLLCLALLALVVPPAAAGALAPGEFFWAENVENLECRVNEDGATVTLIHWTVPEIKSIVVPASVTDRAGKTYAVTKIGQHFIDPFNDLQSVHIPQGIEEIGPESFFDCTNLKSVTFDEGMTSLTTIGDRAFMNTSLEGTGTLRLPYGVTSIGELAFGFFSVERSIIPDTLTYLKDGRGSLPRGMLFLEVGKNTEIIAPCSFRISTYDNPDDQIDIVGVKLRQGGKVTNNGDYNLTVELPNGTMIVLPRGASYSALPYAESNDVMMDYIPGIDGGTIYSVDIEWGALEFTYNEGGPGVWNAQTHTYDGATEQGWAANTAGGDQITVTNHSNAGIEAGFTYNGKTGYDTIAGTLTGEGITAGKATLPTAENTPPENAPAVTAQLEFSGTVPAGTPAARIVIGTVTVTISAAN